MKRMFYHLEVAPSRRDEAETILKDLASRMKGYKGFLGCSVMKEEGHHTGEFSLMHDWNSLDEWNVFCEENERFGALITQHSDEEAKEELFITVFHGHYQVILKVLP